MMYSMKTLKPLIYVLLLSSDHEVATFLDDKLGIDLDDAAFPAAR